jgi:hypothetical protein
MGEKRDRACSHKVLTFCALINKLIIYTFLPKSVTHYDTVSDGRGSGRG